MSSKERTHRRNTPPSGQQAVRPETQNTDIPNSVHAAQQGRMASRLLTPSDVLQLQRTIGNQAVGRLLTNTIQHPDPKVLLSRTNPVGTARNAGQEISTNSRSDPNFQNVHHKMVSLSTLQTIARSRPGYAVFANPMPTTLETVKTKHGKDLGKGKWVLGFVTCPKNFSSPKYKIICNKTDNKPHHWYATIELCSEAQEGTIEGFYVEPGEYDTGKTTRNMPIYAQVTFEISQSAKAAELEHIADYDYAYNITLKHAEGILKDLVSEELRIVLDTPEGGQTPQSIAEEQLKSEVLECLTWLMDPLVGDDEKWSQKYKERFNRTGIRDKKGWHTHSDGGLQPADGSKMIYVINNKNTKININNPGSDSAELIGFDSQI